MMEEKKTRNQLMDELFSLRLQVQDYQASRLEWRAERDRLKELVEERSAEKKLMDVQLHSKIRELVQTREEVERLNSEMDHQVRVRTAELEKVCEEMKHLDEIKDDFLSSVSHELRTPLTSIRSFSEILLTYDEVGGDDQKEFLKIINLESERLTRLINDVLDLSKIQAGRMTWHDDLISLGEVIRETVKAQQPILRGKNLDLVLDVPTELPLVFSDRDRIQQIVTNLLGNAIKFSLPGGRIRVAAETFKGRRAGEEPEWIKVNVSDQGIGIDKDDLEIIFEKFRQASGDTLTDKPDGTGLGLPICREILSHYKGNIWVQSEKGKGSTFFFTLPAAPLSAKADEETCPAGTSIKGWKGKTVLVVDDNRNVRRLLRYQLQNRGYTVLEASNGQEALDAARGAHIDLITLDLMMPTMSGYDLLETLRDDPMTRSIPVLIVSVVEDEERGILRGANDYLKKPFREENLIEKVQTLLGEGKKSILVVDDEYAVQMSLRMQLEEKGFPVDVAQNGEEAIDCMKEHIPDLLILDVLMPRKNGYEVLNWVRKEKATSELPVIILSGCPLSSEHGDLLGLGVDDVVEKPEGLTSLFERIDSMLTPAET